jgi:hypothetical protein
VFENRVLRRILGLKRDGVIGSWRKQHNEKFCFYSSPSIIRIFQSRKMLWAGHIARPRRIGMCIGNWRESQKERDH